MLTRSAGLKGIWVQGDGAARSAREDGARNHFSRGLVSRAWPSLPGIVVLIWVGSPQAQEETKQNWTETRPPMGLSR